MELVDYLYKIDALVLVHIDYTKAEDEMYRNITFSTLFMKNHAKPFIVIPEESKKKLYDLYPEFIVEQWDVHETNEYFFPTDLVLDLAMKINKHPGDLLIGFGGISIDEAIHSLGKRTCRHYRGPKPTIKLPDGYPASTRVGEGLYLPQLSL